MRFHCEPELRRNSAGEILSAKVRWNEPQHVVEWALEGIGEALVYLGFIIIGVSLLAGVAFQMSAFIVAGVIGAAASMALGYGLWRCIPKMRGYERALVFLRDGRMRAPLGLSTGRLPNNESRHPHTGVTAEAVPLVQSKAGETTRYTHGVRLYYRSGAINLVAQNLTEEDAHLLAVVLSQALAALRPFHHHVAASLRDR